MIKRILKLKLEILIFVIFLLSRLPSLGNDTFNTDVWKWKARTYNFLNSVTSLDLAGTSQSYHPGVTLMFLGSLGVKTYNSYYRLSYGVKPPDTRETVFAVHFWQKFYVVLALSFLISLSFFLLKRLIGSIYAFLVIIFISTEPFFVAHSREFHLEALITLFIFVSFLFMFSYLEGKSRRGFFLSALFAVLSLLTKSSALFIVPFNILLILVFGFVNKQKIIEVFKSSFIYSLLIVSLFFAMWPAMWVRPIETLNNYIRGAREIGIEGDHDQLYFGKLVADPGISFYPLNLLLRLTPEVLIGLLLLVLFLFIRPKERYFRHLVFSSLAFVLLFLVYLIIPTKKLDRYLLPAFPFIIFLAISVYIELTKKIAGKLKKDFFIPLVSVFLVLLAIRSIILVSLHPNYLFYYSPLLGGARKAIFLVEPKWAIAGREVGKYFNDKNDLNLVIAFPEKHFTQLWPFVLAHSVIADIRKDALKADYFVYPSWDDTSSFEQRVKLSYEDSIRFKGVVLYNVYRRVE